MYTNVSNAAMPMSGATNNWTTSGTAGGGRTGTALNDVFNSSTSETLSGGSGDDTYNLWASGAAIVENAGGGIDTVNVNYWGGITLPDQVENAFLLSAGATWATGNALNNLLVAGSVGATLDGGAGNDVLVGGAGADVFKVQAGHGSDVIYNFQHGWDAIQLGGYGITSFSQLQSAAKQIGSDLVLQLSKTETLTLRGVQLSGLNAADFNLAPTSTSTAASSNSATHHLLTSQGASNANGWYVVNNLWGTGGLAPGSYSITSSFDTANMVKGTTFNWSVPLTTTPSAPILAYPEVIFGSSPLNTAGADPTDTAHVFPAKLSELVGLNAKYDVSYSGNLSGFDVSYDIWLSKSPTAVGKTAVSNEVMIWLHKGNIAPYGTAVGTYTNGDFSATIYHTGTYTAVVAHKDVPAGTVNVADIFATLEKMGILSNSEYVRSVELGAEIVSGTGSLTINDLNLNVVASDGHGGTISKTVTGTGTTVATSSAPTSSPQTANPGSSILYDSSGHAIGSQTSTTDASGKTTITKSDSAGASLGRDVITQSGTTTMTQHFSSTGVLTGSDKLIHNPDGSTSLQHLNAQNALVSADLIKAANGTVTTYHYDGIFKLLGVDIAATGSDGVVKTQSYDGSFKLLSTTIKGTAGADTLASTGGTTHLYGGAGSDTLAGNSGADYFHFDTLPDQNHSDTINGFTVGQDLIALDHSVFTALSGTGPLDSSIFVVGAKALNASQHLVYDSAHGNLYYDADGSGSQAPVLLAHIASDHALSAANILVY